MQTILLMLANFIPPIVLQEFLTSSKKVEKIKIKTPAHFRHDQHVQSKILGKKIVKSHHIKVNEVVPFLCFV